MRRLMRWLFNTASAASAVWLAVYLALFLWMFFATSWGRAVWAREPHVRTVLRVALSAAVLSVLPAAWLMTRAGRRPTVASHCRMCGYDLRATPDRCPECGAVPKPGEAG